MLMQDELGTIARDLLADLERARPGFPTDVAGFSAAARERLQLRLSDLRAQYASLGSANDFERVTREIEDVMLRRYLTFACAQNRREHQGSAGVFSRVVLGVLGFLLGGLLVRGPFAPLRQAWLPVLLMLVAPVVPDLRRRWFASQHQRHLLVLTADMHAAGRALRDSQPL